MYRILAALVLAAVFMTPSADAQTIGVYFDQVGTAPFIAGSTITYPSSIEAYVIVKGLDVDDGLTAWECSLGYSDSLFVSVAEMYGRPINVASFPNFMVGLADTIGTGTGIAVVAKLTIVAIGPGDVYLNGGQPCSIPGSELPVILSGGSLWPVTTEYGGAGAPCATVGRATRPSLNASGISLVSQYTAMEFRDDGLYAQSQASKSWVKLPTFSGNGQIVLSPEQKAMTMLVPSAQAPIEPEGKRANILFSSGFEDYVPNFSSPFVRNSGQSDFGTYGLGEPDDSGRKYLWGVTNTLAAPGGTRSAYCAANYIICNWTSEPISNCSTYSSSSRVYQHNMDSTLDMFGYQLTGESNARLEFKLWSDVEQGYDELQLYYFTEELVSPYRTQITAFATIPYNAQWANVPLELPTNLPSWGVTTLAFSFVSDSTNGGVDYAGVYLDDIAVKKYDTNLIIVSVNPPQQVGTDLTLPVPVAVTIRNEGTTDSGDFAIAYSRGTSPNADALEGFLSVPSLAPGSTTTVNVNVPYAATADKSFTQRVENRVYFLVDARDEVPETWEIDNWSYSTAVHWDIPNAPVILVHGIMGGALEKSGQQVWGEDVQASVRNLLWSASRLERDDGTNAEADSDPMSVPSAYPPDNGFLRDPAWTLKASLNTSLFGQGVTYPVFVDLIDRSGLWRPLLDNLTSTVDGQYYLPSTNPGDPSSGQDIYLFNYDWRVDLNPSRSAQLAGSAYARLDDLITRIRAVHPGADRLTVVSHSMGGLIVQAYIRAKPNHGIKRWITIGTPFQGSEPAMATLFGANGFHFKVAGATVGGKVADLAKNYVSMWEILPTPNFDLTAPDARWWHGAPPFSDRTNFPPIGYRGQQYPRVIQGNTTMGQIKAANPHHEGWRHNQAARDFAASFQQNYMSNTLAPIANVDTWLIAGVSKSTLRGVDRYVRDFLPLDPELPGISDYRRLTHDLACGSGDEQVSVWSATSANVASQYLHKRYRPNVEHEDLLRDSDVGNFVGDLIRGRDLSSYSFSLPSIDPSEGDKTWYIRWHTDAAVWTGSGKVDKSTQIVGTPVAIDLFDRATNKLLVGLAHAVPREPGVSAVSLTAVNDPRFSYFEIGDDIYITSTSMDHLDLRVVIRPSPVLKETAVAPPTKSATTMGDPLILGHLQIVDVNQYWLVPNGYEGVDFLRFTGQGDSNFGAYMDFSIQNGDMPGNVELWMHIDSNGDGIEEMPVSAVEASDEEHMPGARVVGLRCAPNPFNASTSLEWELGDNGAREIRIFDIAGRTVRILPLTGAQSGSVSFDGRDGRGMALPSGTYLASVFDISGTPRATQKVILAK